MAVDPGADLWIDASLPFFIVGGVTLIAGPTVDAIVRVLIRRFYEARLGGAESEVGEDPNDIADAVSWGSDQFQLLFLLLSLPTFLISVEVTSGKLALSANIVVVFCILFIAATYAYVLRQDSPEAYVEAARIGRLPGLRIIFGKVPILREGSAAVFICAVVSIVTGLVVAILTPH